MKNYEKQGLTYSQIILLHKKMADTYGRKKGYVWHCLGYYPDLRLCNWVFIPISVHRFIHSNQWLKARKKGRTLPRTKAQIQQIRKAQTIAAKMKRLFTDKEEKYIASLKGKKKDVAKQYGCSIAMIKKLRRKHC